MKTDYYNLMINKEDDYQKSPEYQMFLIDTGMSTNLVS